MTITQPTLATIADYFKYGLETGMVKPEAVRAWADTVIMQLDEPPIEIIEVSLSQTIPILIETLAGVAGERDKALAGAWLLGLLRETRPQSAAELAWAIEKAIQIARAAGLGDDIYYQFDGIGDMLFLARCNTYGTVEECRTNLEEALSQYPVAPLHPNT